MFRQKLGTYHPKTATVSFFVHEKQSTHEALLCPSRQNPQVYGCQCTHNGAQPPHCLLCSGSRITHFLIVSSRQTTGVAERTEPIKSRDGPNGHDEQTTKGANTPKNAKSKRRRRTRTEQLLRTGNETGNANGHGSTADRSPVPVLASGPYPEGKLKRPARRTRMANGYPEGRSDTGHTAHPVPGQGSGPAY